MEALIIASVISGALLLAFTGIAMYSKSEESHALSPAEEASFEIEGHSINAANVKAVIAFTLETGVDHPLLTARKNA